MKTSEWVTLAVAAVAAIATVVAAVGAAISARASSETARLLKAEHDAERVRRELEPMFELQALLGEFLAQVVESIEGSPTANQLQRRVTVVIERSSLTESQLPETLRFARQQVATVAQATKAFQEVSAATRRGDDP